MMVSFGKFQLDINNKLEKNDNSYTIYNIKIGKIVY